MSDEMSFVGFTADQFVAAFEESTAYTRREAKKVLNVYAKQIMAASQQMAPIDTGDLEAAHDIRQVSLNQDYTGIDIEVGGYAGGRDVSEYAWIMHELLAPFGAGFYNLGPKSVLKDSTNPPDRPVGGKFLERAFSIYEEEVIDQISDLLIRFGDDVA